MLVPLQPWCFYCNIVALAAWCFYCNVVGLAAWCFYCNVFCPCSPGALGEYLSRRYLGSGQWLFRLNLEHDATIEDNPGTAHTHFELYDYLYLGYFGRQDRQYHRRRALLLFHDLPSAECRYGRVLHCANSGQRVFFCFCTF